MEDAFNLPVLEWKYHKSSAEDVKGGNTVPLYAWWRVRKIDSKETGGSVLKLIYH